MRWLKRIVICLIALLIAAFFHYSLPSRDVVRIVGTDVKRMDISPGAWFWAGADAATETNATRDVRFIDSVWPSGEPRVYRNEDTNWGWPPYLKFESGNLNAQAKSLVSNEADEPRWVVIRHYGWRMEMFSIFPNAMSIREVDSPDVRLIPWFNIVLLGALVLLVGFVYLRLRRMLRRLRGKRAGARDA